MNLIDGLHIEYVRLDGDTVYEGCMKLDDFHAQPFGFLNGGATLAFAEVTAGMMSNALLEKGFVAVGQSVTGHHLKAKKSTGYLYAHGSLLQRGRRSHVWDIKMIDEKEQLIAQVTVVNMIISID